jgi:hypothetical protein
MPDRLLRLYYLATPLFILLDLFFNLNVRAAGLSAYPIAKWSYYFFVLACAGFIWKVPRWSLLTGFVESSVNLVVLFVGFVGPYYRMLAASVETTPMGNPYTLNSVFNFFLSGSILLVAFYSQIPRSFARQK